MTRISSMRTTATTTATMTHLPLQEQEQEQQQQNHNTTTTNPGQHTNLHYSTKKAKLRLKHNITLVYQNIRCWNMSMQTGRGPVQHGCTTMLLGIWS